VSAARASHIRTVFAPSSVQVPAGIRHVPVHHVTQALTWATTGVGRTMADRQA